MNGRKLRCAIYTRKSSEEGLDQAFNSLDAQREAGEAYVQSQTSEGWRVVPVRYDDGGYSGGSMERPALRALLADVAAGHIDVVVVYKIDRLTRSLADFARIVEAFDARGVSFVSVTQAFNTTSSMGRLTLNVLLSFAQFEREVTGERIRDKIAASKAKGMWMGGIPPLGYDPPDPGSRTLRVNANEAERTRFIFTRYLELGSVHRLADDLDRQCIRSKRHVTASGRTIGGVPFSRGALYHLLRNRLYLGKIIHKGAVHNGEHQAIIAPELFDQVQQSLAAHARRRSDSDGRMCAAALTGKLFDAAGQPMSPTHALGRSGKRYRYYVSSPLQRGRAHVGLTDTLLRRVSGPAIEQAVNKALDRLLCQEPDPLSLLSRIELHRADMVLALPARFAKVIGDRLAQGESIARDPDNHKTVRITVPIALAARGSNTIVSTGAPSSARPDQVLISALRRAHAAMSRDKHGPLLAEAPSSLYARRIVGLALLAPDIQRDIMLGTQPPLLTLSALIANELPLNWSAQRRLLGWA